MTTRITCLLFLLLASPLEAATWYVDSNQTTNTQNGTSWATAWTNVLSIAGVSAGDTVYIAAGTYAMASTWTPAAGTAGNPISYLAAQDSGHKGVATFTGSGTGSAITIAHSYFVLNGNDGSGNTNFVLSNWGSPVAISTGFSYTRFAYVNFGTNTGGFDCGQGTAAIGPGVQIDHIYAYCTGASVDRCFYGVFTGGYGSNSLDHWTIYMPQNSTGYGSDGIQTGGSGYDIHDCRLHGYYTASYTYTGEHGDGWQAQGGGFIRVYNNRVFDFCNSQLFPDMNPQGIAWNFNDVMIFNNVVGLTDTRLSPSGIPAGLDGGAPATGNVFSNFFMWNNGAFDLTTHGAFSLNNPNPGTKSCLFTNCFVANSYAVNCLGTGSPGSITNPIDIVNVSAANGTNYFVSYRAFYGNTNDLHLNAAATPLIGAGTNLYGYWATDLGGSTRVSSGAWDIGPYAYTTNSAAPTPGGGAFPIFWQ